MSGVALTRRDALRRGGAAAAAVLLAPVTRARAGVWKFALEISCPSSMSTGTTFSTMAAGTAKPIPEETWDGEIIADVTPMTSP